MFLLETAESHRWKPPGTSEIRSFEGRDDEPPEPDQGGGGTDVAKPFSALDSLDVKLGGWVWDDWLG